MPPPPQLQLLNEKLNYLTRSHGVRDLNKHLAIARLFTKLEGDYPINYIHPRSWNEKVGYYIMNYYSCSSIGLTLRHKWLAKQFTKKYIGEQYVVPTYGIWDRVEDVEWDKLPKSFVIKSCLGGDGKQVIVVHDKDSANKQKILAAMQGYINTHCKDFSRKKVIAEELLIHSDGLMPFQYQFYCARGKPMICRINHQSQTETFSQTSDLTFYDVHNWQKLPIQYRDSPRSTLLPNNANIERPKNLNEQLHIASEISSHVPVSRVDLYSVHERIYVGEITIRPGNGYSPFVPSEWDFRLGEGVEVIPIPELDQMILRDKEKFPLDEIN